jgi:uncharacterized membrane protein YoaK (UPF0700 family)
VSSLRWFTAGQPGVDLYLLTWASGVMDALSFVRARVFTANMTGNTVVLGMSIVGPGRSRAFDSALSLFAFAMGAFIGAMFLLPRKHLDAAKDLKIGTSMEIPFALAFTVLWAIFPGNAPVWVVPVLVATAACALGIQSVAARRLKISGVVTTFITGTITTAIVSFLERNEPGAKPQKEARSSPLLLAGMLVLYILAALTGAALAIAKSPVAALDALIALLIVLFRSLMARAAERAI